MSVIYYIAKRNLMTGHVVDTPYSFDIGFRHYHDTPVSETVNKATWSGVRQTVIRRVDVFWDFETELLENTLREQFEEFIYSVLGGEEFSIDVFGSLAVPGTSFNCKLAGKPQPAREGESTFIRYRFRVVQS